MKEANSEKKIAFLIEEGWPQNIYNITNLCTSTNEINIRNEKDDWKKSLQFEMVIVD